MPTELLNDPLTPPPDSLWFVAHTRPRCEKKLAQHCRRENIRATLPLYRVVHRYHGKTRKTAAFQKPLFPGYVFLQLNPEQRPKVLQSDCVAKLLEVVSQDLFIEQLRAVLLAIESNLEIGLAHDIREGQRVRIVKGPLQGLEGLVEQRFGPSTVLLRIDFIGQAAALQMAPDEFEPV